VKDSEIDELLERATHSRHEVDPVLLDRVAASIKSSVQPVRPLPPMWVLTGGLVLICAAVGLVGASRAGFNGFEKMDLLERVLIFPTLVIFAYVAGQEFVSQLIPGSRHRVSPGVLLGTGSAALTSLFSVLFRDYKTDHFVSAGVACLVTGFLHAIPAAFASWLLLRRGFAVNSVAAGLAAGTLAGLAGVTVLELQCANFQALHVLVWHIAVIPLSGTIGALMAWALRFRRGRVAPPPN
jgi:hypothetical protein